MGKYLLSKYLKLSDHNTVPNSIALAQLVLTAVVTLASFVMLGTVAAYSVAMAGGISALSTWYVGRKIFNSKARDAEGFVQNIYLAQCMKLLLVIALFCVVFSTMKVDFLVFIAAYALTVSVYGFAFVSSKMGFKTT